jgi:hypothetical protein
MNDAGPRTRSSGGSQADTGSGIGSPAAEPHNTASGWISRLRPELSPALLTAVLATAIGVVVLEVWQANLRVPLYSNPGGDETFGLAVIKSILEHGWYLTNPNVGAPLGQHLYDYPVFSGDSLYLLIIKVIGIPFSNPAAIENLFFLLCFPLIAVSAYAALRALRISTGSSIVCAVLFTLLPYHFYDGEGHLFQGAYFTVPLGCYLVIAVLSGKTLFGRSAKRRGIRGYLTWGTAVTVLACLVMGSSDNYYAAFAAALVLLAAVFTFLAGRDLRKLVSGALVAVLILAAVALNGLPTLIYTSQHGSDSAVGKRLPYESDMYALSLADLVLPIAGHRIEPLSQLAEEYQATATAPIGEGHSATLGLIGTLGLLAVVVAFVVRALRPDRLRFADPRYAYAAVGAGLAFLIGTVGGLGTIFAYVVSPQLRAWNRISVFIAFFALMGAGLILDAMRQRIGSGSYRRRWGFAAGLAVVLAVGVLDQTGSSMAPPYKAEAAEYFADGHFVYAMQHQLPAGASVFQLPYVPFPENPPVNQMEDYAELIGYVHSTSLRWSYGQLKGLPSDWESVVVNQPLDPMLAEVSAAGFKGIYVDTFGYTDRGATLIPALSSALGVKPLVSSDGRLYFLNMALYNRRLRQRYSDAQLMQLAANALYPLQVNFGSGFYSLETEGQNSWHWALQSSSLDLFNPGKIARSVSFTATAVTELGKPSSLVVTYHGKAIVHATVSSHGTALSAHLTLAPGHNVVRFLTDAPLAQYPPDTRELALQIRNTTINEPALCPPVVPHKAGHVGAAATLCAAGPRPQLTS